MEQVYSYDPGARVGRQCVMTMADQPLHCSITISWYKLLLISLTLHITLSFSQLTHSSSVTDMWLLHSHELRTHGH